MDNIPGPLTCPSCWASVGSATGRCPSCLARLVDRWGSFERWVSGIITLLCVSGALYLASSAARGWLHARP